MSEDLHRYHDDLLRSERELAQTSAQLQLSEALKAAIVDNALAALVSTDAQGRIVEFNPSAQAMFGRARADVLGRSVGEVLVPPRLRAQHDAGIRRVQAGGAPRVLGQRVEMQAQRADGSEFPIDIVLWRTDVLGATYYTASIVDVTQRHLAARQIERQREALRQSEKLTTMGSLLAGVAHELNNPLAVVMGRAGLLVEKCADPQILADAQRILEAAERCGRIVHTFLNMARRKPATRTRVALGELVRGAAEMLQYSYRTQGIELELALDDSLPALHVDADQVTQVVLNLLLNAQQALAATPGQRSVRVDSGVAPGSCSAACCAWLRISDNGPGINAAQRERIFEPFFTTRSDGTGMGLAMARTLAREHGGDLVLEPAQSVCGASFRLSLPVDADAPTDAIAPRAAPPAAALLARILVVDDEPEIAQLMRDMLESAGYEVASAESGAVALELLDAARFDAVVSDLRMPDMDGAALWRQVGARQPALARRTLFVTGDTLSRSARDFLASTGCASLDKPFAKRDLLERLGALLALPTGPDPGA